MCCIFVDLNFGVISVGTRCINRSAKITNILNSFCSVYIFSTPLNREYATITVCVPLFPAPLCSPFSRACIHFLSAASLTRSRVRNKRLVHPLSKSSRCRRCPRRRTRLSRLPVDLLLSSYSQLASLQQCSVIRIC